MVCSKLGFISLAFCVRCPGGWCEQGEGASLLDGLGAAARAELPVQVPLVRLDGVFTDMDSSPAISRANRLVYR
jgi:hypothetical protein